MKKLLLILFAFLSINLCCFADDAADTLSISDLSSMNIVANSDLKKKDLVRAKNVINHMYQLSLLEIDRGYGPFMAIVSNQKGIIFAQVSNTVVKDKSSLSHAEINAIKETQKKLGTYDLSQYHLSIYVTAEPCLMCAGAIMWSGIENIYYGVPSSEVEDITGFDEGYKPDWMQSFKARNINVYGNIEPDMGIDVLRQYVSTNKELYKPKRTPDVIIDGQKVGKNEFNKLSKYDKYRKFNKRSLLSKSEAKDKKEKAEFAQATKKASHKKYVKRMVLKNMIQSQPQQKIQPQQSKSDTEKTPVVNTNSDNLKVQPEINSEAQKTKNPQLEVINKAPEKKDCIDLRK